MPLFPTSNATYADLLTAQIQTFGQTPLYRAAQKSWLYYNMRIYDAAFSHVLNHPYRDWNEDLDGKRPTCKPLGRIIIDSSAEFLFGQAPRFLVPGKEEGDASAKALEEFLADVVDANDLECKLMPLARQAGNEGSVWAKFAWTPQNRKRPVALSFYAPYEVTAYRDAMDADIITKVRLQTKFQDDNDKQWYFYREDWTADEYTVYKRLKTQEFDDTQVVNQFVKGEWPVERREVNRFGVIPFHQIYNRRLASETDGLGDLWDIYDLLNEHSHAFWLQNRSNQWDSDPITAIFDAASVPNSILPGEILNIQSKGDKQADIKRLAPENNLREHLKVYTQDIERLTMDAVGADRPDPAEITNKGNFTRAVLEFLFHRSVKTTHEKRVNWGRRGLEPFLEALLEGLSRLPDAVQRFPALKAVNPDDPASYDVAISWPSLFKTTPEERSAALQDLVYAVQNGLLSQERAIEQAAELFGVTDLDNLKDELAADAKAALAAPKAGSEDPDSQNEADNG